MSKKFCPIILYCSTKGKTKKGNERERESEDNKEEHSPDLGIITERLLKISIVLVTVEGIYYFAPDFSSYANCALRILLKA